VAVPAGKFLTQRRLCACADSGGVIESFCLTFTAGLPGIGEPMSAALCEDGDDVAVTADNRREYVEAYVDCILNSSVEKQVWAAPGSPICLYLLKRLATADHQQAPPLWSTEAGALCREQV